MFLFLNYGANSSGFVFLFVTKAVKHWGLHIADLSRSTGGAGTGGATASGAECLSG